MQKCSARHESHTCLSNVQRMPKTYVITNNNFKAKVIYKNHKLCRLFCLFLHFVQRAAVESSATKCVDGNATCFLVCYPKILLAVENSKPLIVVISCSVISFSICHFFIS